MTLSDPLSPPPYTPLAFSTPPDPPAPGLLVLDRLTIEILFVLNDLTKPIRPHSSYSQPLSPLTDHGCVLLRVNRNFVMVSADRVMELRVLRNRRYSVAGVTLEVRLDGSRALHI